MVHTLAQVQLLVLLILLLQLIIQIVILLVDLIKGIILYQEIIQKLQKMDGI